MRLCWVCDEEVASTNSANWPTCNKHNLVPNPKCTKKSCDGSILNKTRLMVFPSYFCDKCELGYVKINKKFEKVPKMAE